MIWKEVPFNTKYSMSSTGEIRNNQTGRTLKPWIDRVGYKIIRLGNGTSNISIHRLMAITFLPNPENKAEVNHKDCNKLNNNLENLEWVTKSENGQHSYDNNLSVRRFGHTDSVGSKNSMAKLNECDIIKIREMKRDGSKSKVIAKQFNVTPSLIYLIVNRKIWKHVE